MRSVSVIRLSITYSIFSVVSYCAIAFAFYHYGYDSGEEAGQRAPCPSAEFASVQSGASSMSRMVPFTYSIEDPGPQSHTEIHGSPDVLYIRWGAKWRLVVGGKMVDADEDYLKRTR